VIVELANGMKVEVEIQNTGQKIPFRRGVPVHVHFPSDALRVLSLGPVEHRKDEVADAGGDRAQPPSRTVGASG
jgi:hypothetical protein